MDERARHEAETAGRRGTSVGSRRVTGAASGEHTGRRWGVVALLGRGVSTAKVVLTYHYLDIIILLKFILGC